jgi:hypothetical protein
MADDESKATGLRERLKGRDSGVLLIVAVVGVAMVGFAFVLLVMK